MFCYSSLADSLHILFIYFFKLLFHLENCDCVTEFDSLGIFQHIFFRIIISICQIPILCFPQCHVLQLSLALFSAITY